MTAPGVLTAESGGTAWAWTAVRIEAAADLTELTEYAELPEDGRRSRAAEAEAAWLAGLWDQQHAPRIELRFLSDPAARRLTVHLLGRTTAAGSGEASAAALALRDRLADAPAHVQTAPVASAAEVALALRPFPEPDAGGLLEVRKRFRTALPSRPDAGVRYYLAPQPFGGGPVAWDPLLGALAAHPHPVLLSVGLEPYRVPDDLGPALHRIASQYGRLAEQGRLPEGLWSAAVELTPDAFAVDAARVFADAARRYVQRAFRVRIALASPAPLPESLGELAGSVIAPPERDGRESGGVLTRTFGGPAHLTVRPVPGIEAPAAWHNLTTLEHARWGGDAAWRLPEPLSPQLRLLAELVDAREAGQAFRLPAAAAGHLPGIAVRRPGLPGEADYRPDGPSVALGRQLVHDREAGPLGIGLEALTRHALFAGATGTGKTNSTLAFCEQLWRDHRVPFLVVEPVNAELDDYRWLATRPGFEDLLVLTVGDEEVAPLRLNPFQPPDGVRIGAWAAGLLACFDAAFGLWDPLPGIYNRALRQMYARAGLVASEPAGPQHLGRWPTLRAFVTEMRKVTEALDYSGEVRDNIVAASRLRAEQLAEGACGTTLDVARSFPVDELLRRPVVLELAAVGDNEKEQSLVAALLLQALTSRYKALARGGGGLAHVTVLEEAHRLLGRGSDAGSSGEAREGNARARAAEAFANSLAENRKYGEGLVIVEQVPGKLVEDAYKNTNLKVMHRLPAEEDRLLLGGTMRMNADQERYAATLERFTAFAHHDALDRPALVRVPDVRAASAGGGHARLASGADLRGRFAAWTSATPEVDAAVAPFEECEGCAHRCAFRTRAATAVWPDEHGPELRRRVAAYPQSAAERAAWWRETAVWTAEVGDAVAPPSPDPAALADYRACVFVHAARAAWPRKTLPWVRLYRKHAGAGDAPS
ncbi:hypothetical protein BIV57_03880 [Mangrovactinospora gilvigrisea]|uniref:ATP-binding protein n=1 Tax=Mangrovactinospora gilvigrisea TaxID=1428644 RepID=A0A1J7BJM2_9ACTN|nr:ATP-binding protein [Mangrovactinospora gilvigrisea]OIV38883.1 hypothetical protein BIV57_03880 [Mangrovactinospora gilvigrisea]